MTKWIITVNSPTRDIDSKILQLIKYAGKLDLIYTVQSKEAAPSEPVVHREGGLRPKI